MSLFTGFGEGKKLETGRYIWNELEKKWQRIEDCFSHCIPQEVTIIPDEPEFISTNAFSEIVKWTGRRSKKEVMRKYGCVDARDTVGVGKEKEKRLQVLREKASQDNLVNVQVNSVSAKDIKEKREQRRKTHFTGYRIMG